MVVTAFILSILAFVVSLISLAYLRERTKAVVAQAKRMSEVGSESLINQNLLLASRIMVDYPTLRTLIYPEEGVSDSLEDQLMELRANSLFEILADAYEHALGDEAQELPAGSERLAQHVRDTIAYSAGLRAYIMAHRDWYDERLVAIADQIENQHEGRHEPDRA